MCADDELVMTVVRGRRGLTFGWVVWTADGVIRPSGRPYSHDDHPPYRRKRSTDSRTNNTCVLFFIHLHYTQHFEEYEPDRGKRRRRSRRWCACEC